MNRSLTILVRMSFGAALKAANDRLVPYAALIYASMAAIGVSGYGGYKLGELSQKVSSYSEMADLRINAAFDKTKYDCETIVLKAAVSNLKLREKERGDK